MKPGTVARMSAINNYVGIWVFGILLCLVLFFILFLLFGSNWVS